MSRIPIIEFTRRLIKSGGITPGRAWMIPVYYIQLIISIPFGIIQSLFYSRSIRQTRIIHPPVFILGHYRSGTTLLQKLLASDKRFGVLTNYDSLFPNVNLLFGEGMKKILQSVINLLRIKNPFFNKSPVLLSEAAEEDDYLMNRSSAYSAYWGFVYPRKWKEWLNSTESSDSGFCSGWEKEYLKTVRYATYKNQGKPLVLKSPPNTGRVKRLLHMFPDARFIYLYRNPYNLYFSLRNMWKRAILPWYSLQKISDVELDDIIFGHFLEQTRQYEREKIFIPDGHLIELSYEEIMDDTLKTVIRIYSRLGLPPVEETLTDLIRQIETEKEYTPFRHDHVTGDLEKVNVRWKEVPGLPGNGLNPGLHRG